MKENFSQLSYLVYRIYFIKSYKKSYPSLNLLFKVFKSRFLSKFKIYYVFRLSKCFKISVILLIITFKF